MRETVKILGVEIDNLTKEEAGLRTKELIEMSNKSCKMIFAPNVEFVMYAQKDKEFFDILKQSELSTPDSIGITLAIKRQGLVQKERIPRTSLF